MATVGQHCASKQVKPVQLNQNQCLLESPLVLCLLVKRVINKVAKKNKGETRNSDDSSRPASACRSKQTREDTLHDHQFLDKVLDAEKQ